jgi:hypothetical protein
MHPAIVAPSVCARYDEIITPTASTGQLDRFIQNLYLGLSIIEGQLEGLSMRKYVTIIGALFLLTVMAAIAAAEEDLPPEITMTTPINAEDSLDGTVEFVGTATDDNEVSAVEWRVDDGLWFTADGTDSWSFELDTSQFTSSAHKLWLRASDGINFSMELEFDFSINQIPLLEILGHVEGKLYKGAVEFAGTAFDDIAVVMVEVKVNGGEWIDLGAQVAWSYKVPTGDLDEGKHTFEVRVWDGEKYSEVYSTTFKFEADENPGFGMTAALLATLIAVPIARRRMRNAD